MGAIFWDDDEPLTEPPPSPELTLRSGLDDGQGYTTGGLDTRMAPSTCGLRTAKNGLRTARNGLRDFTASVTPAPSPSSDKPDPESYGMQFVSHPDDEPAPMADSGVHVSSPLPLAMPRHDDIRIQGLMQDLQSLKTPQARLSAQGLLDDAIATRRARIEMEAARIRRSMAADELRGMAKRAAGRGDLHAQARYQAEAARIGQQDAAGHAVSGSERVTLAKAPATQPSVGFGTAAPRAPANQVSKTTRGSAIASADSARRQRIDAINDFLHLTEHEGFNAEDAIRSVNRDLVIVNANTPGSPDEQTADAVNDYHILRQRGFSPAQAVASVLANPTDSLTVLDHGGDTDKIRNELSKLPTRMLRTLDERGIQFAAVRQRVGEFRDFESLSRGYPDHSPTNDRPGIFDENGPGPFKTVVIATGAPPEASGSVNTTLHEAAHAYDRVMGYPSRGPEFRHAYNSDATSLGAYYAPDGPAVDNYYQAHGNKFYSYPDGTMIETDAYLSETFAEALANRYGDSPQQLERYRASQPDIATFVPSGD